MTPAQAAALQAGATVNVAAASGALTGALVLTLNRPLRCEIGTLTVPISARDVDDQPSRQRFDIYGKVLPTAPPGSIISNVAMVTSSTEAVNPAFPQAYLNGRNNVATASGNSNGSNGRGATSSARDQVASHASAGRPTISRIGGHW